MNARIGRLCLPLVALLALTAAAPVPKVIANAVSNPDRPDADRARDAARKPAEVIAFAGLKPGATVVDFIPGNGYFTRIFANIVGNSGHVYAIDPAELVLRKMGPPPAQAGGAPMPKRAPDEAGPAQVPDTTDAAALSKFFDQRFDPKGQFKNVTFLVESDTSMSIPVSADLVWTSRNYHDLHNPAFGSPDMVKLDRSIYETLKPGGIFLVLDHSTAPGKGFSQTNTLHRSDPEAVVAEVEQAGFKLVGRSDLLANPADDHTKPVFDPSLRDHTDQYILKFQRPE
jgi:predicted methyltransferase